MDDRLRYWEAVARLGTRGEMVYAILADWRAERHQRQAGGLVCRAYQESGRVCGQLATQIDVRRGIMVCEEHAPADGGSRREHANLDSRGHLRACARVAVVDHAPDAP
jgi:hypothetical protein